MGIPPVGPKPSSKKKKSPKRPVTLLSWWTGTSHRPARPGCIVRARVTASGPCLTPRQRRAVGIPSQCSVGASTARRCRGLEPAPPGRTGLSTRGLGLTCQFFRRLAEGPEIVVGAGSHATGRRRNPISGAPSPQSAGATKHRCRCRTWPLPLSRPCHWATGRISARALGANPAQRTRALKSQIGRAHV